LTSHSLSYVAEQNTGMEWVYVDDAQVTSGDTIYASQWLSIICKYENFHRVQSYELSESFGERVDWDYNLVPKNFSEFSDDDFEL
jgi:hypothetical protein